MILLDTNIISEMMKQLPNPGVINWIEEQEVTQLYISSISIAEIAYGINVLPNGNRRHSLEEAFYKAIKMAFKHHILFFDEASAHHYGRLMSHRKNLGKPLSILDGQIASIAVTVHNIASCNEYAFALLSKLPLPPTS